MESCNKWKHNSRRAESEQGLKIGNETLGWIKFGRVILKTNGGQMVAKMANVGCEFEKEKNGN